MDGWKAKKNCEFMNPYWKDETLAPRVPYDLNYYEIGRERYKVEKLMRDLEEVVGSVEWTKKDVAGDWESVTLKSISGGDQSFLEKTDLGIGKENKYRYTEAIRLCPYIKQILDAIPTDVYLVRLLRLAPRARVKFHTDKDIFEQRGDIIRCHIPIKTNPAVMFQLGYPLASPAPGFHVWDARILHEKHLCAGWLWYTNVNTLHGVSNDSDEERVHLVVDMRPPRCFTETG
jgi:quercetin dioxygenase-like cupin family protein